MIKRMRMRSVAAMTIVLGMTIVGDGEAQAPGSGGAALVMPVAGVPVELAEARALLLDEVRYDLALRVPAVRAEPLTGQVHVDFTLAAPVRAIVLDFARPEQDVRRVEWRGRPATWRSSQEHLMVIFPEPVAGVQRLTIDFAAGDEALNRDDEFLYSLFVPARARFAFPCFDQPDVKARLTLTLDLPSGWTAVANGREASREAHGDRAVWRFAPTPPLSTYLMAFAAGRLHVETAIRAGRTFRMFHRETDRARLDRSRDIVFDLHASALAWLEDYTGIPYPWDKLDFFLVPAFQFGGMEHAGAIFYNAPALLLEASATKAQELGRASLIAHEVAHMWFGDLVTMRWFNDVWMKEVFANFMAAKIVNPSFPEVNHELRFLLAHYPAAYSVDRTGGTHPIRQPLANLNEAGQLYGPIIYQKAPIMMRQLERLLGPDTLRDGLRAYLKQHAFGNASWPDLVGLLDARTADDLAAWSRVWVEESGRPVIESEVRRGAGGRLESVMLRQRDPAGRGFVWPQQVEVAVGDERGVVVLPVRLQAAEVALPSATVAGRAGFVLANGGGLAYGLVSPDAASVEWLRSRIHEIPDALTRGSAWVTLWDLLLERRIEPAGFIDAAVAALPVEDDELNLQRVLDYLEAAYWRHLSPAEREARVGALEAMLRAGLDKAGTPGRKNAWFRTLARVALTPPTLAWLERVWAGEETVPGLVLSEPDYITLSLELAVRGTDGWRRILDEQEGRIENPDRLARFRFVRVALDADPSVRAAFFARLAKVEERRREPWVLEALSYLHHPLRAPASAAFVRPSLEMLEEIRRTGDIFFPKRWMDTTLAGHQSPEVARTVRAFLASRPDYPVRLRQIVLQAADELLRR